MDTLDTQRRLEGRIALVTGAGSGIGRAVSILLTRCGAHVVIADRKADRVHELSSAIRAEGGQCTAVTLDVADHAWFGAVVTAVVETHGRLDILINNAGLVTAPTSIAEFDESHFDRLMAVNLKGVFNGMNHALPVMIAAGRGTVLNVGSVTAVKVVSGLGPYAASKQAVTALTRAGALEAGPHGVRVNELQPGPTETPLVTGPPDALTGAGAGLARQVPLGRLATPEEQAHAALFLVSDEASFVNGASLLVDGGMAWT